MKRTIRKVMYSAAALLMATSYSNASSQLLPGFLTGLPLGAPLPEGVYDITIPTYGWRDTTPQTNVAAVAPVWLIWSTPWTLLGGHIALDAVSPLANVTLPGSLEKSGFTNPLLEVEWKWALGGGFFGGFHAGVYVPVENELTPLGVTHNYATFQGLGALSYLNDGWNLTATLVFGTGHNGSVLNPGSYSTSWLNIDLTATKKFDKIEAGVVAFGSTDLNSPVPGYKEQSQFAVGGLVGYDFGPLDVQLKLTRDVTQSNYGGYETRFWSNIIIPIWTAPSSVNKAVVAKY